jgi:4-amino-4-deoxy-L-arabinose transferase-like glycosyltransferase
MAGSAYLAGLCLLAFGLRAMVVANTQQMGLFADMQEYHDRATHLLNTGALPADAFRVPLFPIFIAAVYRMFGQHLLAVRLAQALLGTITVALTYFIARRIASNKGALCASLVVAVYPALLLYSAYVMAETIFACLAVAALALWGSHRWWTALLAGLAVGAATLTRSVGLALLAGIVLGELWRLVWHASGLAKTAIKGTVPFMADSAIANGLAFGRLALFVIGFAIALAPWVQRNYGLYQRVIPTDTSSGFNVLLGNYPGATGRHPGIPAVEAAAQTYWNTTRNDLERSEIGMQVGRDFVRDNPGRAATLAVLKVGYLFGVEGREHAWGYSHHLQGRRDSSVIWAWGIAIMVSFPVLMTVASIGLWRPGITRSPAAVSIVAIMFAVTLLHVASFGDSRFHLPWIPLVAILAARAVAPREARPWTLARQTILAMWLVGFALLWKDQWAELMTVLPKLAESPVPLGLPY